MQGPDRLPPQEEMTGYRKSSRRPHEPGIKIIDTRLPAQLDSSPLILRTLFSAATYAGFLRPKDSNDHQHTHTEFVQIGCLANIEEQAS